MSLVIKNLTTCSPFVDILDKFQKGEIDIYFDYHNIHSDKYTPTVSTFIEDYVVLGKQEDNHIINSFESLKDKNIVRKPKRRKSINAKRRCIIYIFLIKLKSQY